MISMPCEREGQFTVQVWQDFVNGLLTRNLRTIASDEDSRQRGACSPLELIKQRAICGQSSIYQAIGWKLL